MIIRKRVLGVAIAALLLLAPAMAASADGGSGTDDGDAASVDPKASSGPDGRTAGPEPEGLRNDSPTDDVIPVVAEKLFQLGSGRGFVSQRTDYDERSIHVVWSGNVPTDIRRYAETTPYAVAVTFDATAKYSREEGSDARDRLLKDPIAREIGVVTTSVTPDGSGISIGIAREDPLDEATMKAVREAAGIQEIDVQYGVPEATGYARRSNDAPPWKGGIRTYHMSSPTGVCSSGFAVIVGGMGRLLSARHCDLAGGLAVRDGNYQLVTPAGGDNVKVRAAIDSMLIDPTDSPATKALMYRNGYASTTTSTVKNWYSNWPGDPVCSSGGSTGEHCGTVYDDNGTVNFQGHTIGVIRVSAPAGSIIGGAGDSGGPMFKKVTGGVQARGILLGPDTNYAQTTSCGTVNPDVGLIQCSRYINYVPISTILDHWSASLQVA